MTRVLLCLLAFAIVAPLSIGCGKKPAESTAWLADGDPKEQIEMLKSKPQLGLDMRIVAAKRLGAMGPRAQEALPDLEKLTKDKNRDLATAAQDAIAKIKGE